ncbi:MAG: fatty acid desaturase [Leptolyngbyaceae cyanobacterium]
MTATVPPSVQVTALTEMTPALNHLKLSDVIRTIPKECFEKDWRKAWLSVLTTLVSIALGVLAIALSPWYLLPLAWIFTGTAATGLFVIGHDCGHRSFAKRRWVNNWVGHIAMLPLVYPFHCWRILHDHHHVHTNKLHVDNAWEPWTVEAYQSAPTWLQWGYRQLRGNFWWVGSVAHWAVLHFDISSFAERDRRAVKTSVMVVAGFAAIFFPTLYFTVGLGGIIKFWLMPWLGYHFWMSTFTIVHHTIPEIQFHTENDWSAVPAQLAGTVHCTYPKWIEILCHDINVHVPHHLSTGIPSYNLRQAHHSLLQNWGEYIYLRRFSWQLMGQITRQCHLYDAQTAYRSFQSVQ